MSDITFEKIGIKPANKAPSIDGLSNQQACATLMRAGFIPVWDGGIIAAAPMRPHELAEHKRHQGDTSGCIKLSK